MQEEMIKRITLESELFEQVKTDFNFVLQRLIGNMLEKDSSEGSVTLKMEISLDSEFIPNYDKTVEGESREIHKPKFKHKITSNVQIKDEKSGNMDSEMELVMDENGCYVLKPIINTTQRSIFDTDMQETMNPPVVEEQEALPGHKVMALPGPEENPDVIDGEFTEVENEPESQGSDENSEEDTEYSGDGESPVIDATDALFGGDIPTSELPLADDGTDGYEYQEPEE